MVLDHGKVIKLLFKRGDFFGNLRVFLRRHRIIWQDDSAWDFSSSQGLENEGILCVFLVFQTAELAEKTRRGTQTQLCGDALKIIPRGGLRTPSGYDTIIEIAKGGNADGCN